MKIFSILMVLSLLFFSCASKPSSYDSFSARESSFNTTNVTVSEKGLSQEQITSILATRFPPENTVSIAVIFLHNYSSRYSNNDLPYYIMSQGKNINGVEKFVPIPRIFYPRNLTFDIIQDLGIRSLCEYTLIFYNNSGRSIRYVQIFTNEYKFESDIEYLLLDNQTTAIIASDRLYSSLTKRRNTWESRDFEELEDEIYTLQAELLKEKLNLLFNK